MVHRLVRWTSTAGFKYAQTDIIASTTTDNCNVY
jgi:hypothetical protein